MESSLFLGRLCLTRRAKVTYPTTYQRSRINLETSPRRGWDLNQEAFDELLAWLNPDRERAGRKYEDIRQRLIRIFMHRGCLTAGPSSLRFSSATSHCATFSIGEVYSDEVRLRRLRRWGERREVVAMPCFVPNSLCSYPMTIGAF